jgi:hypothetical protein
MQAGVLYSITSMLKMSKQTQSFLENSPSQDHQLLTGRAGIWAQSVSPLYLTLTSFCAQPPSPHLGSHFKGPLLGPQHLAIFCCLFFAVIGFETRAYTLSHSTSPIFGMGFFKIESQELFARLASNLNPPDLCLLSS